MNFGDVLTVTLTLFAVIDILGSIPIIIGLRSKMGHIQSEKATLVSGLDNDFISICRRKIT